MKNKKLIKIILLIYILVPTLIFFNKELFEKKFFILTILGSIIYITLKIFKIPNKELGITNRGVKSSIKRNIPFIIICIIIIIILKSLHMNRYTSSETIPFYIFYIFISCPIQEFLYRGIFGYFEKIYKKRYLWILISSICYSYLHIIYKDILTCFLTFIIGIIWYLLYKKDYNLVGVSLSHILLGILTIYLGIIN